MWSVTFGIKCLSPKTNENDLFLVVVWIFWKSDNQYKNETFITIHQHRQFPLYWDKYLCKYCGVQNISMT